MDRVYIVTGGENGEPYLLGYDSEDGEDFIPVLKFDNPFTAVDAAEKLQTWYDAGGLL